MSEPIVAVLPVENISVEDGFNPRTHFDEDALSELGASLRSTGGVVQPLAVQAIEGESDKYTVIAGERRLRALRAVGIEKVPVLVLQSENAKRAALAENTFRVDLDPIEYANGLEALAELEGLTTHKKIAERVDKSAAFISAHLRLLKLPEAVQKHIAAGTVPVAAERVLRKVAEVSPAVAECACRLVEREVIEARDLIERFGEVLIAIADCDLPERPTMIDAMHGESLSRIVTDPEKNAGLAERYQQAYPHEAGTDPLICFSGDEVDAARAAGCLIEFEEDRNDWRGRFTVAFVTDPDLAADLAARVIERVEKQAKERASKEAERAGIAPAADLTVAEQAKEVKRAERKQAKEDAEAARNHNLAIGRALIARRGAKSRKDHKLAWAKAVAAVVLADNDNLAAAGLRLTFEQLQEVEHSTVKSTGAKRTKVTYANPTECREYLMGRIEEARTAEEVLERLAEALIATLAIDEKELPRSRRVNYWLKAESEVSDLLAPEVKAVRPRRRAKKRS